MDIITLTPENLADEHICCTLAKNDDIQVRTKKTWLAQRMEEGLVFKKGAVRGKCFIEYLPAEVAWVPLEADGYLHINCLWVSGHFKGQGWSTMLLNACLEDARAQDKHGVTILSSQGKKRSFLADPNYLAHTGFRVADVADPYFALMVLPLQEDAPLPAFKPQVSARIESTADYTLYYTDQCPFTAKYVPLLEAVAKEHGVSLEIVHLDSGEKARLSPSPFTTFSLYQKGEFITNEILSEKKFISLIENRA